MKVSLNWIKDFVDLEGIDTSEIWRRFTMSTAEVEDVIEKGKDINGVIVAEVVEVKEHPSSSKLKVCKVDTGRGIVQSLCGAPNLKAGIKVPFALEGGSIQGIPKVEKVEIGGVESYGVICSAAELGISDRHEGVMVLPSDYVTGKDLKDYVDIDDVIAEIDNKSLTNRPDLWGHYGIAREIAAIFGRKLKAIELETIDYDEKLPDLDIVIEDEKKCFRYCGLGISNVKGGTTPMNMQVRLYYCGMRPIEPIVDLTNYIMLEIGQPMHAFDRRQIQKLVVKSTTEPISFFTLDDVERKIPADVLMINNNDQPVAIAGIMGGRNSEILEDTTDLFLESANFEGSSIRKSSMAIGLRTEASARFEKMLDPALPLISIQRFVYLLKKIKPDISISSNLTDVYPVKPKPVYIEIEKEYIDRYVGQSIEEDRIVKILKSLEFEVEKKGSSFTVKVPSFRATKDVTIKADLVEEITRIYGYDNIKPRSVDVVLKPLDRNRERETEHRIKELLAEGFGFNEVHTYVWFDSEFNSRVGITSNANLRIINPHAENCSLLRDTMVPSMLQAAESNSRYFDDVSIFEIGSVFKAKEKSSECQETKSLSILLASVNEKEDELFYRLKGITDKMLMIIKKKEPEYTEVKDYGYSWIHPVKSATIFMDGKELGYITVIHPMVTNNMDTRFKIAVLEMSMPVFNSIETHDIMYMEPSRYQVTFLDFSFLVGRDIPYKKIKEDIEWFKTDILISCSFVDLYEGKGLPEGKKSITFRFEIGSREKTLSSREIEDFSDSLIAYMEEKGYPLR